VNFTKSLVRENTYLVSFGGKLIGKVCKVGKVFRGTSEVWEAWQGGAYLGQFSTRKEAGEFLMEKRGR
jgi:hypothetical protein